MTSRYYRDAAAGAAVIAALTLAACGTSASTGAPVSPATSAAASVPAAPKAFSTADSTFTTRMLGLEGQSAALAGAVTGHAATPEIQQFAARMRAHAGDAKRMRELMGSWQQSVPAPYSTGASPPAGMMGVGMMNAADWAEISSEHGQSFSSHWLDAMIGSYNAEVALCRQELGSGTSPQARALARSMLAERQSELPQLQQWHQDPHMGMMG